MVDRSILKTDYNRYMPQSFFNVNPLNYKPSVVIPSEHSVSSLNDKNRETIVVVCKDSIERLFNADFVRNDSFGQAFL